ncbi:MAG: thiaminase II [Candidatus Tectomicrobia bacterium]|nr:thiaminase II [Candidatus Tectomicrobia bacterium]
MWRAIFRHPFLREVGGGTLAIDRFRYFILQDSLYLQDFARALLLAGSKAHDPDTLKMFAEHAAGCVEVERALHRGLARRIGLSPRALKTARRGPVTEAYTRHLLSVAQGGTLAEAVAALLPCYWVYWEVGKRLSRRSPKNPVYREWVSSYASEAFGRLVRRQLRLVDDLGERVCREEQEKMKAHFRLSSRYEYLFWDAAYRREEWPV